jgi:hypothetical protein
MNEHYQRWRHVGPFAMFDQQGTVLHQSLQGLGSSMPVIVPARAKP